MLSNINKGVVSCYSYVLIQLQTLFHCFKAEVTPSNFLRRKMNGNKSTKKCGVLNKITLIPNYFGSPQFGPAPLKPYSGPSKILKIGNTTRGMSRLTHA